MFINYTYTLRLHLLILYVYIYNVIYIYVICMTYHIYINSVLKSNISSKKTQFFHNKFSRPPSGSQVIREAVKASVMASTTSRLKAGAVGWG